MFSREPDARSISSMSEIEWSVKAVIARPITVKDAVPFGPDVILPEQFYDGQRGMDYVSGERALMLAVLEDGIRCFQEHLRNPRVRPRLLARQAERWIRSDC